MFQLLPKTCITCDKIWNLKVSSFRMQNFYRVHVLQVFVVTAIFAVMRYWFVFYSLSLHRMSTGTPEEEILNTLKCNGLHHFIHTNPEKNQQCISWVSPAQLSLLTALGEVLMLGATYKVNNTRLP